MAETTARYEVFATRDGEGTDESSWHRVESDELGGGLLPTATAVVDALNAADDGHTYELMDAHLISPR